MVLRKELSEKELQMFTDLGFSEVLNTFFSVASLYRIAVEKVFMENLSGNAVESLRRCCNAIHNDVCYRKTKEFDDLISL